jgi:uncharacterized membrane protein
MFIAMSPNFSRSGGSEKSQSAEDLLKKRFVEDEIDEETYKRMLQTLRRS